MVNLGDGLEYLFNLGILYFGAEAPMFGLGFLFFLGAGFLHTRRLLDPADKRGRRWFSRVRYLAAHTSELGVMSSWSYPQLLSLFVSYSSVFKGFAGFYLFFWFALYLGVSKTLLLYGAALIIVYAYLYFSVLNPFRGYHRLYSMRLDLLDPKPGVLFLDRVNRPSIQILHLFNSLSIDQLSGHSYYSNSQRFSFALDCYPNKYNIIFLEDPFSISKFLYYYTELYIYNSIHSYWEHSINLSNSYTNIYGGSKLSDLLTTSFYPAQFLSDVKLDGFSRTYTPSYLRSCSSLYTVRTALVRQIVCRVLDDSTISARRLRDTSFDISIDTAPGSFEVAWHKVSGVDSLNKLLADVITEKSRVHRLLEYICVSYFSRFDYFLSYSSFQDRLKHIFFQLFPPSYYVRWLTFFLSFNLSRTYFSLISKSFLLPIDWFGWAALYYFERWAGRTKLGLMLSRFATGFDFFNTLHVLKRGRFEFFLDATLYPTNRFKKYYYFDGVSHFPLHRSFNFLNRLLGISLLRPFRIIVDRVRTRRAARAPLTLWDYDAVPVRETWYSGDGLEPFLDPDGAFLFNNFSFINDLRPLPLTRDSSGLFSVDCKDYSNLDNFLKLCPILDWARSHLSEIAGSESLRFLLSLDPNTLLLKEVLRDNPSFAGYSKNLFYKAQSSRFYGWFRNSFSHLPLFPLYDFSFCLLVKSPVFSVVNSDACSCSNVAARGADSVSYVFNRFRTNKVNQSTCSLTLSGLDEADSRFLPFFLKKRLRIKRLSTVKASIPYLDRLTYLNLSTWNIFKWGFSQFPLFFSRRARSFLRLIFRDPFLFYSSSRATQGINYRRFFWSSIFRSPVLNFLSKQHNTLGQSVDGFFAHYLIDELGGQLVTKFGFVPVYVRWLFFNWRQLKAYMFDRFATGGCTSAEYDIWLNVEGNPFNISIWLKFFDYLFADTRFFFYSCTVLNGLSNSVGFSLGVPSILDALRRLLAFRNEVVLRIPTNYSNFLLFEESAMFNRWDWKAFVSVGSSWVYSLLSTVYLGNCELDYTLFRSYSRVISFFNKAIPDIFPRDETELLKPGVYRRRFGYHNRSVVRMHKAVRDRSWQLIVPAETSFSVIDKFFMHYCTLKSDCKVVASSLLDFHAFLETPWPVTERLRLLSSSILISEKLLAACFSPKVLTRFDFLRFTLRDGLFSEASITFMNEFRFLCMQHSPPDWSFDYFYGLAKVNLEAYLVPGLARDGFSEDRQFRFEVFELEKPVRAGSRKPNRDYFNITNAPDGMFFDPAIPFVDVVGFKNKASDWHYSFGLPRPEIYHERMSLLNIASGSVFVRLGRINVLIRSVPVSSWSHIAFFTYKRIAVLFQRYVCLLKNFFKGRVDPLQL